MLRAPVSVPGHCQWRSFSRIDAVRQLLNEHRRVPARAGGNAASTSAPSGLSGASVAQSPVGNNADHAKEGDTVNTLVKELLRIFTRKVPGSLVPDELVRGFVHVSVKHSNQKFDPVGALTALVGVGTRVRVSHGGVSHARVAQRFTGKDH